MSTPLNVPFQVTDALQVTDVHENGSAVNVTLTLTFTAMSVLSANRIADTVVAALVEQAGTAHVPAINPHEDDSENAFRYTHTHVDDGSPARMVASDGHLITLVNDDGFRWTDPLSKWMPIPD